jgi:hypothetical protein
MKTTIEIGDAFETEVYNILSETRPFHIEFFKGGGDRGRDIRALYDVNGVLKEVIVECKYIGGKRALLKEDISPSVTWAISRKPGSLLYIWTTSHINTHAKDWLRDVESNSKKLVIRHEEKENFEAFRSALINKDEIVFEKLRDKILTYLKLTEVGIPKEISLIYEQLRLVLPKLILAYCKEKQIDCCIEDGCGGVLLRLNNKLIEVSCILDYKFNATGSVGVFINDSLMQNYMQFPSLMIEITENQARLSALALGGLDDKIEEKFTSLVSLTGRVAKLIIKKIDREFYDHIY